MQTYVECGKAKTAEKKEVFMCLCNGMSPSQIFPTLTFNFNGFSADLAPENYVFSDDRYCYLTITGKKSLKHWILGTNFMRHFYW
jgi:hypothetical protein